MQKKLKGEGIYLNKGILVNKLIIFFILFLFSSFAPKESNYCKMSDQIVGKYVKEFVKPHGLVLTSYGGRMMDDIKEIELHFLSFDTLDVECARKLYVEMIEEFLRRINSYEKIRPYLHNFPFEVANINLIIGFEDCKRKITSDGHVALMYIGKNQDLLYRGYHSAKEEFYSLHKEPYEEARRIVIGK